ncbi:MAG: carboxypeptidase regulatory-like domain-containing protein [Acidobacteriota bacterium]|nr:carboxypeptidase regulatory-like domain-containing protein [Acidobacteriota bacterium]
MLYRSGYPAPLRPVFLWLFVFISSFPLLHAQAGQVLGGISGTALDSTGATIAGASVTLSTYDHPAIATTSTGPDGAFRFSGLQSGAYQIEIAAPGFAIYKNASLAVAVGRETRLEATLQPAQSTQQVTVQAQTETLDISQSAPVTNIDKDRIEELPIPSRNYLNFTLLSPALAGANPALARQTPGAAEGGFSAGGLRPPSNALYIDGADDNDEYTGLSRTELSPEAISDFQVVNHGYAAQAGGSAGGSVDVETRAGANTQHGDAFLFVQNGALNGTPALEAVPNKPDENRLRAGLSTGGALRRDRLFYYLAAEQEMARGEEAGDFTPQQAAQINGALRQAGPLQGFQMQQGFFPTTNEETELSGRLDRSSESDSLMLRYAMTNNRAVNDAFHLDDLTDLSARGSASYDDNSVNAAWNRSISSKLANQMVAEVAQRRVALRTGSQSGPGVVVAGIATFGTPFDGNSRRYETHADMGDALIRQHGKHLVQAGVAFSHIGLRAANRDGFGGLYVFPSVTALATGQADFYMQSFGNPNTNFAEMRSVAYAQDHWTALRSLALDYGLRYEDNHVPAPLPNHALNLSPRVGFAWSPQKQWVMRGGFGIFYDRYLLGTINHIVELNGTRAEQQIAEGPDAAALYRQGQPFTTPHASIAPSIWQAQKSLANPYAETASLGVERSLPDAWTVGAEYRFVHGVKMGRTVNSNLLPPVALNQNNAGSLGIPNPTPQQIGQLVFGPQRVNPANDAINQFQTEASSSYNGATVTVNRQFTEDLELMAGYTFAKTIDDASYDTEQPQNPFALKNERGLSLENQRHRFVLSGLWVIGPDLDDPQDAARAAHPNAFEKLVYGLEFAPILSVGTGFPDNPLTGVDSNREHIYPFATRPQGQARNGLTTPSTVNFDLRVLKMVPIWRGHLDIVAESFNLLNRQNVEMINPVFGSKLSPASGWNTPLQESDARRVQFSLDYEY